jgi:hypothetical protein
VHKGEDGNGKGQKDHGPYELSVSCFLFHDDSFLCLRQKKMPGQSPAKGKDASKQKARHGSFHTYCP